MYKHTPEYLSQEPEPEYLSQGMIESTFVEIINKNEKNMVAGWIYKHPKRKIPDFLDNYLLPLLEKLSQKY